MSYEKFYEERIVDAVEIDATASFSVMNRRVDVKTAYKNDSDNPHEWTYCVQFFENDVLKECDNGVTLRQASHIVEMFAATGNF